MENNEKKDIESILKNILFFTSITDGFFNYNIPIKSDVEKFNSDKSTEPSLFLFEYICYKLLKNILISNKQINSETIIITDQFLCSENSKEQFIKYKATYKKNIIICIQNTQNLKWTIIAFLNLEEQIKNYFDINNKKPIKAKILSSNLNSDEDDILLNATMDKLEYAFDFKSPDDIQFEVDSFNIYDQPNSGIFLLNFIKELMLQDETKISDFIQKIYDEVSNIDNTGNKFYFNKFNNISEEMNNIYDTYKQELNEFLKNNNININLDDELNSDEEEEALKIMEKENEEAKHLMRQKERKLRQKLYKQKLIDKNMVMYKEFGVIKEEDNESESESIDFFGKMKEKEEERLKFKENLNKKNYMNNNKILNNVNVNININVNNSQSIDEIKTNIFKTDNDIQIKNQSKSEKNIKLNVYKELEEALEEFELEQDPIKNTEENIKQKKEEIKEIKDNNQKETESKDITNILNKIEEKEKEKSKESETNTIKEKTPVVNQSPKEQKDEKTKKEENKKEESKKEENKKEKKKTNKSNNNNINIFRNENIELKKRGSVPKTQIKIKKLNLDFKYPNNDNNNKTTEKLKKSFTNMKRPDNKDLSKEKEEETNNNSLLKKKSVPIKELKNTNSKEIIIQKNSKEIKQINSNSNNNSIKNIKNNTSKKININKNKDEEKNLKIIIKEKENYTNSISINKEPRDNLSKRAKNLDIIIKTKNLSKKNSEKYNNKKTNSQTIKTNQEQHQTYTTKKSTSSSNKSDETDSLNIDKEIKSVKKKIKPFIKQSESIEEKATLNVSLTDNPINMLPPQKIVERNALLDLRSKEKDYKDLSSVNSTKKESDYSSNINIENIGNDFSETEKKSEFSDRSYVGRERIRKTNVKRSEKVYPPGKVRNSKRYEYGALDKEDTNKICGCIGEQANGICNIF